MTAGLSDEQLLSVWESGSGRDDLDRGLLLWSAGDQDARDIESAPLGRRDSALLRLRERTFGPVAECFVACPQCGESLEFELDLRRMLNPPDTEAAQAPWTFELAGWQLRCRLPNTGDLRAIGQLEPSADLKLALLSRTVLTASYEGSAVAVAELPAEVIDALDGEMGRRDPAAELSLDLDCAACGHHWLSTFDIAGYFWREVESTAHRLLLEVDSLARAYGWSEPQILGLNRTRRRRYLELVDTR